MLIWIVEDDPVISGAVSAHLTGWGYECACATDFQHITDEFARVNPQLMLMDISLPFYNGFHWCGEIRRLSRVPSLFISSAAANMSIVMAVNMGGDDFIAKPFDLNVLSAKVRALLRRSYDFSAAGDILECGELALNLSDMTLSHAGVKIELTRNEFRILQTLMENRARTVSRDTLMQRLWETDSFVDENTLTVNMTRLRRKLSGAGIEDFIKTKKGVGYIVE